MKCAILVDGAFYRRRAMKALGEKPPKERAKELNDYCWRHLKWHGQQEAELYRIFYYDCPPITKQVQHCRRNRALRAGYRGCVRGGGDDEAGCAVTQSTPITVISTKNEM